MDQLTPSSATSIPAKSGAQHGVRHVAIIMDGNGRWAKARHLPRLAGHKRGVEALRDVVRSAADMGLEAMTLYAFSSENWRRPEEEVGYLMTLMKQFILADLEEFAAQNVRLKIIGDYKAFKPDVVKLIEKALARTAHNDGLMLAVALNYGAQDELVRAAQAAAATGIISAETIAAHLDTADMPPLDLIIRTSGEYRLSNFLLWQAAYAELFFTDVLWPDYTPAHLQAALDNFAARERRFGGL
jgi:undecaprenyl diphosphate synthase